MNKQQLKPFHRSFIDYLSSFEMYLKEEHKNDRSVFIIRFRLATDGLLALLSMTIVPETALSEMIKELQSFWESFKLRNAESISSAPGLSGQNEKKLLEKLFIKAITDLQKRLPKKKLN